MMLSIVKKKIKCAYKWYCTQQPVQHEIVSQFISHFSAMAWYQNLNNVSLWSMTFFFLRVTLQLIRQSQWFQVKLSTIKWLSEWVCVNALLVSSYDALASRLPLFGLFPCRFTLWVREQPWTELRWGMALSDHHYTSPPFHLHLIILISPRGRVRARVFVHSVLSCFTLSARACWRESEM